MSLTQVPASMQEPNAQYTGFKNRVINGAMMIDQRNAGASATINANAIYFIDRWRSAQAGQTWGSGVVTAQRVVDAPAGFYNSMKLTVATADASLAATDGYTVAQLIEANNVADLNWGSANASPATLGFWAKTSVAGTYAGSVVSVGSTIYAYTFTFALTANTWTYVSIPIPAQTTNNTPVTGVDTSMGVFFDLGSGSNLNGTANTWNSGGYFTRTSGSTNWISNAAATFNITGVQLEKGSTATSFDYRPYGAELALCQRYFYQNTFVSGDSAVAATGYWAGPTGFEGFIKFPVTMRAIPTLTYSGSVQALKAQTGWYNVTSVGLNGADYDSGKWGFGTDNSGEARGTGGMIGLKASGAYIRLTAEL